MNVTVRRSEADADEEFHFVIKSPPKSSFIRMMHKFSRPFFNEVTWYEDLIPMLEVVNGKNCIERMLPKCYFAYSNYYMQVQFIIFLHFLFHYLFLKRWFLYLDHTELIKFLILKEKYSRESKKVKDRKITSENCFKCNALRIFGYFA